MPSQPNDKFFSGLLESVFRTSKKTIQEYVREVERHCRYKSMKSSVSDGVVLDDRSKLIDLYEACAQQDAHLAGVLETVKSQIIGERYMLAKQNERGKYVKDVEETRKIQGTQFVKAIEGIVEARWYGYSVLEINPEINPITGKLKEINIIERRNVLPNQHRVVRRQGIWEDGWDITSKKYLDNYVLINTDGIGLFSATTPLSLAKKFVMANYINFTQTYGQPIIHGKTESESNADRYKLAQDISNAAQNKVIVTGINDSVDVKAFATANSEQMYRGLIDVANSEIDELIVGSQSMAGATQSYVGSTNAHQDIFRDRIEVYRDFIENVMNEEIVPRLVKMGYLKGGLEFKYSNRVEMSNKDKINLYSLITDRYEVSANEIENEFGIQVGRQLNTLALEISLAGAGGAEGYADSESGDGSRFTRRRMSNQEYYKRYGYHRNKSNKGDLDRNDDGNIDIPIPNSHFHVQEKLEEPSSYKEMKEVFFKYLKVMGYKQTRWQYLKNLSKLRFKDAMNKALQGFGVTYKEARDIVEKKDDSNDKYVVISAAINNLSQFSVYEEFSLFDELPDPEGYDSYDEYLDECEEIFSLYNKNYASIENDDVFHSMLVAAAFSAYHDNTIITYITQRDDRVRPWHAALDGLSYPKHSFPDWMIPPIEHGCRCFLEEENSEGVIASIHNASNKKSEEELKKESNPVFKESVAKGGRIFSLEHSYFSSVAKKSDKKKLNRIAREIANEWIEEK